MGLHLLKEAGSLDNIFLGLQLLKETGGLDQFFFSCVVIMDVAMIFTDRTIQRPEAHYFGHLRIGGPRKLSVPMLGNDRSRRKMCLSLGLRPTQRSPSWAQVM